MRQKQTLVCESCARFRRLGGYFSQDKERKPQSADPLIPCKVGVCMIGGACGSCRACGKFHESETPAGAVPCSCGAARVVLEPRRYVLPWSSCKNWLAC